MPDDWFSQFATVPAPSAPRVMSMSDRPKGWNDADEQRFRPWYAAAIKGRDLDPNPDNPEHHYNYRAAFKAGAWPGADGHWPSEFKDATHPNRFVDGQDTITGQPAAHDDFFSQFEPVKPSGSKSEPAKAPSWLDSVGTFLDRATKPIQPGEINKQVQAVNPLLMAPGTDGNFIDVAKREGVLSAVSKYRPVAAVRGVLDAQGKLAADAQKDFEAGNYGAGVVKALHYLIPVLGPGMQHAGDELQQGNIAAGLGDTAAIAGSVVAPELARGAVGAVANRLGGARATPAVPSSLNPAEAEALRYVQDRGVQVPASTATGNAFLKGADAATEAGTVSGSIIGGKARLAREQGLATLGDQLAAKGYGTATTKEAAGESLDKAIRGVARQHGAEASYAYQTLRAHEADPANLRTFEIAKHPDPVTGEPMEAPKFFAPRGAPKAAVFDAVYSDAVKQGWKGTKQELRNAFEERVGQAKDLGVEMRSAADDFSNEALLRDVRKLGLRPALKEGADAAGRQTVLVRGDFAPLVDAFKAGKWRQGGGASVFRKDGYPLDELVQRLNQDPKYADLTPNGLMSKLSDIAAEGPSKPKADLEGLLGAVDVRPGTKWWDHAASAADRDVANDIGAVLEGKHLVRTESVPLGVDLRGAKQGLQPLYERLSREKEVTGQLMGHKGAALTAIDGLMRAPDVAPLSVVDGALGEIKASLRKGKRAGEFMSDGQGATFQVVRELEHGVQAAAREAGPEVLDALMEGRAATVAKYKALDVLDLLKDEPVATVKALTAPKGGNIKMLRRVAQMAPDEMPKIGRAWLDEQIGTATAEGGFKRADKLYADWQKLDGPTKALIFKDPAYIKELDNFFLASKKLAENVNPSGSAKVGAAVGHVATAANAIATGNVGLLGAQLGYELTGAAVQKLMHTPTGVRLLTQGLRIPTPRLAPGIQSAAVNALRTKVVADLARFAGPDWYRNPVVADDEGSQP